MPLLATAARLPAQVTRRSLRSCASVRRLKLTTSAFPVRDNRRSSLSFIYPPSARLSPASVPKSTSRSTIITSVRMASSSTATSELPVLQNVLDKAKSPYLLQHKDNPVAWQEWTPETIARAQAENKLIFLSVGYSACHWCHVLAHESFEDETTAEIMNKYFINIKVDREERPDVDRMYMTFLQATQGGGGWPLSVWLTPTLEPVFAGTYFPRMQFRSLLAKIHDLWSDDPESLTQSGKRMLEQLKEINQVEANALDRSLSDLASMTAPRLFNHLSHGYDPVHGGFSKRGPKFPSPSQNLVFLSRYAAYHSDGDGNKAREMGQRLLRALWEGGIRDWVGNGLARYSVDAKWRVPHFEKMLYDQAQIISCALDFAVLARKANEPDAEKLCYDLANDILIYTSRDLQSPRGGFYSAEDADSVESFERTDKHSEGAFYVWTKVEFDRVVGEDAEIAGTFWNITDQNIDPSTDAHGELTGKNTLYQAATYHEVAEKHSVSVGKVRDAVENARSKLLAHRDKTRPRPHLDDKILTSWNGLMVTALAQAAAILPPDYVISKECIGMAEKAVAFIREELWAEGRLARSWREGRGPMGQADDYAFLIKGLLDLYEVTGKEEHVIWAEELQQTMDELFSDLEGGGYFASAPDPHILMRLKDAQDGAEPAATSIALHNLQRLALYVSNRFEIYSEQAKRTYASNQALLERAPFAFATSVAGLMDSQAGYREFILVGPIDSPFIKDCHHLLFSANYIPNKVVIHIDPRHPPTNLARLNPVVADVIGQLKADDPPSLRVCENFTCHLPVNSLEEAQEAISRA